MFKGIDLEKELSCSVVPLKSLDEFAMHDLGLIAGDYCSFCELQTCFQKFDIFYRVDNDDNEVEEIVNAFLFDYYGAEYDDPDNLLFGLEEQEELRQRLRKGNTNFDFFWNFEISLGGDGIYVPFNGGSFGRGRDVHIEELDWEDGLGSIQHVRRYLRKIADILYY